MKVLTAAGIGLAVALAGTAVADDLREELATCAQLQNAEVRLACYDTLASVSASRPDAGATGGEEAGTGNAPAAAGASAAAAPAQPAPDAPAQQPESEESLTERFFGMLPGGGEDNSIESRVVGEVNRLRPGTRFTLENGQVWQQTERRTRNYKATNPRVEISEGFMNSYRMRLEGLNARIRVRRVK